MYSFKLGSTSNKAAPSVSSSCCLTSYLLYSSILSPHAKLEDPPFRIAPSAKKQQRGRLHATCRWSWLLAGESIIESWHNYPHDCHTHTYTPRTQTSAGGRVYVACYSLSPESSSSCLPWFSFGPFFGVRLILSMTVLFQKETHYIWLEKFNFAIN